MSGVQTAQDDDPKLPPLRGSCAGKSQRLPALGSRLGDEITVGGIKYSDSLQADELLFKQASPSTQRRRPHQPGTLGIGAWEMWWGGSQVGHVPVPQDLPHEGSVWALGGW